MDKIHQDNQPQVSNEKIADWMVNHLSNLLSIKPEQVEKTLQFDDFGLDSRDSVGMIGELSDWLKIELDPSMIDDHPTIEELSTAIVKEMEASIS